MPTPSKLLRQEYKRTAQDLESGNLGPTDTEVQDRIGGQQQSIYQMTEAQRLALQRGINDPNAAQMYSGLGTAAAGAANQAVGQTLDWRKQVAEAARQQAIKMIQDRQARNAALRNEVLDTGLKLAPPAVAAGRAVSAYLTEKTGQ